MSLKIVGLSEINGPLVALDGIHGAGYEEMVELELQDGTTRTGRIVQMDGDRCIIQVFEGTRGLSLAEHHYHHSGTPRGDEPLQGAAGPCSEPAPVVPIDGLGEIYWEKKEDINGKPLNPVSRTYPRNYINTGISAIDCLMTLIRGQKLPIFSGSRYAAQQAGCPRS